MPFIWKLQQDLTTEARRALRVSKSPSSTFSGRFPRPSSRQSFVEQQELTGRVPDYQLELMAQATEGIEVEEEHFPTLKEISKKCSGTIKWKPDEFYDSISKDHLAEHPYYYTRLFIMEDQARGDAIECINWCKRRDKGKDELKVASEKRNPMETTCVRKCLFDTITGKKRRPHTKLR